MSVGVVGPSASSVISVSIVQGNISEQQADILVNSAPEVRTSQKGVVLEALLKAGGKELADEFAANHPGKLEPGKAFYTRGHRLPCQKVCYMSLPHYRPGVEQVLDTLITACLTEANKAGYTSVAFPVLGTGGLGYPPGVVARTTLGAVSKFNKKVPSTTLRDVKIVIYHKNTDMLTIFHKVHSQMESIKTDGNETSGLPTHWTSTQEYRVTLAAGSPEYQTVKGNFTSSLGRTTAIISIERVQNAHLWRQYTVLKDRLDKQNPGQMKQMTLWHGTHPGAATCITEHGFTRNHCGLNGSAYGRGVYFALKSEYSAQDTYSKPDVSGYKRVFQGKVLVGHTVKGNANMNVLPDRLPGVPYDSATDNVSSPNMYIIFNNSQAYPEYLITFLKN